MASTSAASKNSPAIEEASSLVQEVSFSTKCVLVQSNTLWKDEGLVIYKEVS